MRPARNGASSRFLGATQEGNFIYAFQITLFFSNFHEPTFIKEAFVGSGKHRIDRESLLPTRHLHQRP
jgi:hypothetical protein